MNDDTSLITSAGAGNPSEPAVAVATEELQPPPDMKDDWIFPGTLPLLYGVPSSLMILPSNLKPNILFR